MQLIPYDHLAHEIHKKLFTTFLNLYLINITAILKKSAMDFLEVGNQIEQRIKQVDTSE